MSDPIVPRVDVMTCARFHEIRDVNIDTPPDERDTADQAIAELLEAVIVLRWHLLTERRNQEALALRDPSLLDYIPARLPPRVES